MCMASVALEGDVGGGLGYSVIGLWEKQTFNSEKPYVYFTTSILITWQNSKVVYTN